MHVGSTLVLLSMLYGVYMVLLYIPHTYRYPCIPYTHGTDVHVTYAHMVGDTYVSPTMCAYVTCTSVPCVYGIHGYRYVCGMYNSTMYTPYSMDNSTKVLPTCIH